ncbi:MAG: hypothetical protein DHS20C09_08900 [marine bacterium B5-7]|nr:MAG: hypothetical protein DHS20C09_08900 [marine bacterium B5-7]
MGNPMAQYFMFMDVGDVAQGHDCTDAGGKAKQEARAEDAARSDVFEWRIIILLFSTFLCVNVSAESLREFQERQCKQGKQESCERAADMLEGEQHAERIVQLGDEFAANVDRSKREADKKPVLGEAYLDVLDDYFKAEAENGIKLAVTSDVISLCAEHYHDYWINRKMWWPTNNAGKPDWSTIYYYIVDHYYGYCLRNAM